MKPEEALGMKVGFIGLGNIGNPLAASILRAGHSLVVHDLLEARASNLVAQGAVWARSPKELAALADIVVTSLPGPKQVAMAVFGLEGVSAGAVAGKIWIDMSTVDPDTMRANAEAMGQLGVEVLEAPVTGGVARAACGEVTIFTGGSAECLARARPILAAMAGDIIHMGAIGSASATKLITNAIAFVHEIALGEGLVLGARNGIDPENLCAAMRSSYADSFVLRTDAPEIFSGEYARHFAISLACKDLRLTMDLMRKRGLRLPAFELADNIFRSTMDQYGDVGCLSVIKRLEEDTGTPLASIGRK